MLHRKKQLFIFILMLNRSRRRIEKLLFLHAGNTIRFCVNMLMTKANETNVCKRHNSNGSCLLHTEQRAVKSINRAR